MANHDWQSCFYAIFIIMVIIDFCLSLRNACILSLPMHSVPVCNIFIEYRTSGRLSYWGFKTHCTQDPPVGENVLSQIDRFVPRLNKVEEGAQLAKRTRFWQYFLKLSHPYMGHWSKIETP